MRKLPAFGFLFLAACAPSKNTVPVAPWYPAVHENGDPLFAAFESRVPCADPCQAIKVSLVLYRDKVTQAPSAYKLARVHVGQGNDRLVAEGRWTEARGTKLDSSAVLYRLDAGAPRDFQAYWVVSPDILFILDDQLMPRAGTSGYGYVLNRRAR